MLRTNITNNNYQITHFVSWRHWYQSFCNFSSELRFSCCHCPPDNNFTYINLHINGDPKQVMAPRMISCVHCGGCLIPHDRCEMMLNAYKRELNRRTYSREARKVLREGGIIEIEDFCIPPGVENRPAPLNQRYLDENLFVETMAGVMLKTEQEALIKSSVDEINKEIIKDILEQQRVYRQIYTLEEHEGLAWFTIFYGGEISFAYRLGFIGYKFKKHNSFYFENPLIQEDFNKLKMDELDLNDIGRSLLAKLTKIYENKGPYFLMACSAPNYNLIIDGTHPKLV